MSFFSFWIHLGISPLFIYLLIFTGPSSKPSGIPPVLHERGLGRILVGIGYHDNGWVGNIKDSAIHLTWHDLMSNVYLQVWGPFSQVHSRSRVLHSVDHHGSCYNIYLYCHGDSLACSNDPPSLSHSWITGKCFQSSVNLYLFFFSMLKASSKYYFTHGKLTEVTML